MSAASFRDLLAKRVDEVKPPQALPEGTYTWIIDRYEFGESRQKKTPQIDFHVHAVDHEADVNEEELLAIEGWDKRGLRKTFYLTDNALYRLTDFLKQVVGAEAEQRTIEEVLPATVNRTFKAECKQVTSADGKSIFSNIGDTMADE